MVGKIPEEFILKENKYELKRYIISGCFLLYGSDATLVPYPYIRVTFINYGQYGCYQSEGLNMSYSVETESFGHTDDLLEILKGSLLRDVQYKGEWYVGYLKKDLRKIKLKELFNDFTQ